MESDSETTGEFISLLHEDYDKIKKIKIGFGTDIVPTKIVNKGVTIFS